MIINKNVPLFVVRNLKSGALYTPVPVDFATANEIASRIPSTNGWSTFVGYGIPYVGVFRL